MDTDVEQLEVGDLSLGVPNSRSANLKAPIFPPTGQDLLITMEDKRIFHLALQELERCRSRDLILPSYHNLVTQRCLEVLLRWMLVGLIPFDIKLFLRHSRYGNFQNIRGIAVEGILLLGGLLSPLIVIYLLELISNDPSRFVRYQTAKSLACFVGSLEEESDEIIAPVSVVKVTLRLTKEKNQIMTWNVRKSLAGNLPLQEAILDVLK